MTSPYYYENDPIADLVIHLATQGPQDKLRAALADPRGPLDSGFPALFSQQAGHAQWRTVDLAMDALKARPELAQAVAMDGTTALHVAAEGHLASGASVVHQLLAAGANPLMTNNRGYSVLDILSSSVDGTGLTGGKIQQIWPNQEAMLDQIIDRIETEYGADGHETMLALEEALRQACAHGRLRTASHLIERGAQAALDLVLEDDEDPKAPLELAAGIHECDLEDRYQDQLVRMVLGQIPKDRLSEHLANRGGDVTDVEPKGPLRAAAGEYRTNVMRILMQHGAVDKPARHGSRATALMDAAWNSCDEAVELLVKGDPKCGIPAGSPSYINHKDVDGNTALHHAMLEEMDHDEESLLPIVKVLLEAGADPRMKNKEGETPIELARRRECDHLAEVMQEAAKSMGPRGIRAAKINTQGFDQPSGQAAPEAGKKKPSR